MYVVVVICQIIKIIMELWRLGRPDDGKIGKQRKICSETYTISFGIIDTRATYLANKYDP